MSQLVHLIAAARPNFMKVAPLYHALRRQDWCRVQIVHTGQHYDANMSDTFFHDLRLPEPDYHLGVGSGSHAEQTGGVMIAYGKVAAEARPDWIIVVGDVNSTLACCLVGAKLGLRTAHLEAGLRSRDRSMPEELNRIVTDQLSDLLWTPSADADANLLAEGIPIDRIECVGNIMIDSFEMMKPQIEERRMFASFDLVTGAYGVVTLHRPSNVDTPSILAVLVDELVTIGAKIPLIFPVHPRTRARLQAAGLLDRLVQAGIRLVDPLGYVDFMSLVINAGCVITDSGGVQEETTYVGIPCLTVRENTERPITVTDGTNRLVKAEGLHLAVEAALKDRGAMKRRPDLWDGQTAGRVVASMVRHNM